MSRIDMHEYRTHEVELFEAPEETVRERIIRWLYWFAVALGLGLAWVAMVWGIGELIG